MNMFRSILPKEYAFFDYFDSLMVHCNAMATDLLNIATKKINLNDGMILIKGKEKLMDQICVQCLEALHKTFITPIERTDILKLIKKLDSIADNVDRATSRLILYELEIRPDIKQIAEILVKATSELQIALRAMRDFKDVELIKTKCAAIRKLEFEGDDIFKKAISEVFQSGDAIAIIKWKEIYEKYEKAINRCEDSANLIEEILIESA